MKDALDRPLIAEGMKRQIEEAFRVVPEGKRGALLVIADMETQTARAHLAAKVNNHWKVAAGVGVPWDGRKPEAWVGVVGSW